MTEEEPTVAEQEPEYDPNTDPEVVAERIKLLRSVLTGKMALSMAKEANAKNRKLRMTNTLRTATRRRNKAARKSRRTNRK